MDRSGGARVKSFRNRCCREIESHRLIHAKEAQYMQKRPIDISETRLHLTEDDTELWVTICHIRRSQFRRTGAHIFRSIQRCFVLLTVPLQLSNAMLVSLLMHCFTAILTSRISQALLQAVLDKEERNFIGWFIQYEFPSLPG
jgi:hypothetical protein